MLGNLHPEEYKAVISNMKHCILATDLALFFPNKARLANIVKEKPAELFTIRSHCSGNLKNELYVDCVCWVSISTFS